MKNIWKKIGFAALLILLITVVVFSSKTTENVKCWKIEIDLDVSPESALITENELKKEIESIGTPIIGSTMENIKLVKIQKALSANPLIKNTTVHKTVDGILKISAEQRIPFLRIINEHGTSFLVDKDGSKMPTLNSRNPHVMLFTGRINESLDGTNLALLEVNESMRSSSILDEIFQVATHLETSDFWSSQVEHVYVNQNQEFELIPRVGNHKILIGESENLEDKLSRLELFYKETVGKRDINKYAALDVRFNDQVVCKEFF